MSNIVIDLTDDNDSPRRASSLSRPSPPSAKVIDLTDDTKRPRTASQQKSTGPDPKRPRAADAAPEVKNKRPLFTSTTTPDVTAALARKYEVDKPSASRKAVRAKRAEKANAAAKVPAPSPDPVRTKRPRVAVQSRTGAAAAPNSQNKRPRVTTAAAAAAAPRGITPAEMRKQEIRKTTDALAKERGDGAQALLKVIERIEKKTGDLGFQHDGKQLRELALQRMLMYWQTIRTLEKSMNVFIGDDRSKAINHVKVEAKNGTIQGTKPDAKTLQKGLTYVSVRSRDADRELIGAHAVVVVDGQIFDCNGKSSEYATIVQKLAPGLTIVPTRNMQRLVAQTPLWKNMVVGRGARGWCSLWALMCMVLFNGNTEETTRLLHYIFVKADAQAALIAVRATTIMAYHHYLHLDNVRKGKSAWLYDQMFSALDNKPRDVYLNKQKITIAGSVIRVGAMQPRTTYSIPTVFIGIHIHSDDLVIRATLDLPLKRGFVYKTDSEDFRKRVRDVYAPIIGEHADVTVRFLPKYYRVIGTCVDLKRRIYCSIRLKTTKPIKYTTIHKGQKKCKQATLRNHFIALSAKQIDFMGKKRFLEQVQLFAAVVDDQTECKLPSKFQQNGINPKFDYNSKFNHINESSIQAQKERSRDDQLRYKQVSMDRLKGIEPPNEASSELMRLHLIQDSLRAAGRIQVPTTSQLRQRKPPYDVARFVELYRTIPDNSTIDFTVSMSIHNSSAGPLVLQLSLPGHMSDYDVQRAITRDCASALGCISHEITRSCTPLDEEDEGQSLLSNGDRDITIKIEMKGRSRTTTVFVSWPILLVDMELRQHIWPHKDSEGGFCLDLFPESVKLRQKRPFTAVRTARSIANDSVKNQEGLIGFYHRALGDAIRRDNIKAILQDDYNG